MNPQHSEKVRDRTRQFHLDSPCAQWVQEKGLDMFLLLLVIPILLAVLVLLLSSCQSTQDLYLVQATGHATTVDVQQALGPPTSDQVTDIGQRRWLYRRDGEGTGGRDFTPYCQDLWLTFDHEGILRTWDKHRC